MINKEDYKQFSEKMDRTISVLEEQFAAVRAGRANPAILDKITVEYYGTETPINQVGNITVPEARMLSVSVWDKNLLKHVEKGIMEANLGLNPMNDGVQIRIPLPPLSEERRLELVKVAGKYAEETRIAVRNIRRDILDKIKKMKSEGDISEDEQKRFEDEIQKITDTTINDVDALLKSKETEIKQV